MLTYRNRNIVLTFFNDRKQILIMSSIGDSYSRSQCVFHLFYYMLNDFKSCRYVLLQSSRVDCYRFIGYHKRLYELTQLLQETDYIVICVILISRVVQKKLKTFTNSFNLFLVVNTLPSNTYYISQTNLYHCKV